MLFVIATVLLIAWVFGIAGAYTVGPVSHLLLIAAVVLFVIGVVTGRRRIV